MLVVCTLGANGAEHSREWSREVSSWCGGSTLFASLPLVDRKFVSLKVHTSTGHASKKFEQLLNITQFICDKKTTTGERRAVLEDEPQSHMLFVLQVVSQG